MQKLVAPSEPESAKSVNPRAPGDLLTTIHERIIPQLVLAHAGDPAETNACPATRLPPTAEEVAELSRLAVAEDFQGGLRFIERMASAGLAVDVILLELVAPAARLLGDEWLDDLRSFTEVTIGLNLLHRIVHVLGPSAEPSKSARGFVVLVAAPSEQHTLGIFLLAEFLRKDGWGVLVDPAMPQEELLGVVRREYVDAVGISVSNTDLVGPLTRLVAAVRSASMNDDIAVMIGGSLVLSSQAEAIGAIFSNDPHEAVALVERHAARRKR